MAFIRLETLENSAEIGLKLAQLGVHNPLPPMIRKLLAQRRRLGFGSTRQIAGFLRSVWRLSSPANILPMLMRRGMTDTDAAAIWSARQYVRHLVSNSDCHAGFCVNLLI